ncbi:hypothetical protein MPSEU_001096200 [Mayamaea pseudoterrestris]|nr:hypothetical protein MPSEU_001096200 [Mayamaea pseudoterrestris]
MPGASPSMQSGAGAEAVTENERLSSSSLTCCTTILPPLLTVGGGHDEQSAKNPLSLGPSATTLSYLDSSPAWQVSFSLDGAWLVVAIGSPSACVRVYHNAKFANGRKNLVNDSIKDEWILQATLRSNEATSARTIRSVAVAPLRSLRNELTTVILASASFDGSISIWEYNSKNGNQHTQKDCSSHRHDHDHHDCNHDHSSNNGWQCLAQLEGHESEVKCVCWNATASLLASCGRDKTVWIWEAFLNAAHGNNSSSDWECLAVLPGHDADVKCVQFASSHDLWGDGDEILLSGSYDDTVKVWAEDAGEWYCVASLANVHSSTIWSLAVAPSSTRFISGSADGSLAIYKAYTSAEYRNRFPEEAANVMDVSSHRDGVWKCVGKLPDAHSEPVYSVSYAPARCGHGRIASGGGDGQINVYRETLQSMPDEPKFVMDVSVATGHGDVNHVCWHPWDGSLLTSVGDDGAVRLWKYTSS